MAVIEQHGVLTTLVFGKGDSVPQTIQSHVLDNGLVLVGETNDSLESVSFSFLTPGGCRYDPAGRAGLASIACDMSLRGAGSRDSRQFLQDLETLGVERHESVTNANLSFSGATIASNLAPALTIYADLLRRPAMPSEELHAARQVVLQELHAIDDEPSQKLMLELRRRFYPDPFGRSSHGDEAGLAAITLDDVRQHFTQGCRPNGTILGIAGRFDWQEVRDLAEKLFGDWQPVAESSIAETGGGPRVEHLEHDSNQTQIGIAYPSVPYRDPDYFQASGAIGILSGGMSSRLFTEVREKRGLCYTVFASLHSLEDRACVLCYAGTSAERAQETLDVTLGELHRLGKGVTENELARLKARIKSGLIMQQESSAARSSGLTRDWFHLGKARTLDEVGALVDRLSCETINTYLTAHPAQDFTVVTLGPKPLEVPVGIS